MTTVSLIRTDNLTKRYPGGVLALDGLTLDLEPGLIGLVGANGAGKSTLIKILLGLLGPTGGSASVLGRDSATDALEIRQRVGYLPEHDCLPTDISAADFITHMAQISGLPWTSARERAADMLRHVGLYEERYRLMDGYSTGMKQRVKLAQALVHGPVVLLLDEPTNGLDPAGRDEMLDLIRRTGIEFGISVIVSSHLLGEIERVCDHLVAIDAGRLVHSGPIGDITEHIAVLAVELDEGVDRMAARLREAGLDVQEDGVTGLLVGIDDEGPYDLVRDVAAELELPLVRMERRRRRLEELFRRVGSDGGRAAAVAAAAADAGVSGAGGL